MLMFRTLLAMAVVAVATPAAAETVVIHAGRLLATPGTAPLEKQTIIVRDDKIAELRAGFIDPSSLGTDARLVDLSRQFVLPGMMDLHAHITMRLFQPRPARISDSVTLRPADLALRAAVSARQVLLSGFTTIRDLGAPHDVIFPLRDALNGGMFPGPHIIAAGSMLSRTGGHGDSHLLRPELRMHIEDYGKPCSGVAACREGVRERVADGADVIKISVSGSGSDETGNASAEPDLLPDELETIIATARSLNRRVATHVTSTKGINAAVRAGVNTIEHGTYADKESFELMKQKDVILVPTTYVSVFLDKPSIQAGLKPEEWAFLSAAIKRARQLPGEAYRAGVKIALGTDAGGDLDANRAQELDLYVQSGLPAAEAIKTATVNAAEALGMSDRLGQIKPGFRADIIAVTGDPLVDVKALSTVDFVMKDGQVYKSGGRATVQP